MPKKILIVDDSSADLTLTEDLLKNKGYEITTAMTAQECIEQVKPGALDLVILDAVMPEKDGFTLCREIKQLKLEKMPKVIIFTGTINAIEPLKARKAGADDFAIKTANANSLLKAIRNTIDPKRILVIEDSPTVLDLLQAVLEEEGFQVTTALNGKDGVKQAKEAMPDLVIIDIRLPDIDGFEVCSQIHQFKVATRAKIMMVTASIDAIDAVRARRLGCDEFTVKTADCRKIIEAVQRLI